MNFHYERDNRICHINHTHHQAELNTWRNDTDSSELRRGYLQCAEYAGLPLTDVSSQRPQAPSEYIQLPQHLRHSEAWRETDSETPLTVTAD